MVRLYLLHFLKLRKGRKWLVMNAFCTEFITEEHFYDAAALREHKRGSTSVKFNPVLCIHVLAERIKFLEVNEVQPISWKPKILRKVSVWLLFCFHLMYRLHAPAGTAVWKSETSCCKSIRLHPWGDVVPALLLPWVWQRRESVVGHCIWDITCLSVCTAPQLLWYPGTWQPWAADMGGDIHHVPHSRGKQKRSHFYSIGGLIYPHHQP